MKVHYITKIEQYQKAVERLKAEQELAVDTETCILPEWIGRGGSALDPHTGRISLLQLATRKKEVYIFDLLWLEAHSYNQSYLIEILENKTLLGHNIKFDVKHIKGTLGIFPENLKDTMILWKLLGNALGSKFSRTIGYGLADLVREFLGIRLEGKEDKRLTDWGVGLENRSFSIPYWREKLLYAARDVLYLFDLYDILYPVLVNPFPEGAYGARGPHGLGMGWVVDLEFRTIVVTAAMEYWGMPVNEGLLKELDKAIEEELVASAVFICKQLGLDTDINPFTGKETPTKESMRVLRSASALPKLLTKAIKLKKINDIQSKTLERMIEIIENLGNEDLTLINEDEQSLYQELKQLEEGELMSKVPLLKAIVNFKKLVKQQGMNLVSYINPKTGRIHTQFDQLGTATGRYSSNCPNIQQVPARFHLNWTLNTSLIDGQKGKDVSVKLSPRLAFADTTGESVLVDIDFSSQEALLAAAVSGDEKLIDIYKQPKKINGVDNALADIHTLMAKNCCYPELFEGVPVEDWVKVAKTPLSNGVVPRQRGKILSYGSIYMQGPKTMAEGNYVTVEEATRWIQAFRKTYTQFTSWATRQSSIAEATGLSRNINGRLRWCAESNSKGNENAAGRTGVNHQIQSLAADIGKLSLVRIYQALKQYPEARIISIVHDEIILECPGEWRLKDGDGLDFEIKGQAKEIAYLAARIMEETESELIQHILPGQVGEPMIYPYWAH